MLRNLGSIMTSESTVYLLRRIIKERLTPYIDRDYVFLDLPYYSNVGDSLIAIASMNFLSQFEHQCLYYSSENTFDDRFISSNTLIIFTGGGNFGDLWRDLASFRNSIIRNHPQNPYLILPQSVAYLNRKNLNEDVAIYSQCPNITICARDQKSYDFLKCHFICNNVILVPDMAFCFDIKSLELTASPTSGKILFLKRNDKEFLNSIDYSIVPDNAEIHDWPTIEKRTTVYSIYLIFEKLNRLIYKFISKQCFWKLQDLIWQRIMLPYNVKTGINFINRYEVIYTTRLHVAIIGVLLNKETYLFDNIYNKNSALYNTWLKDTDHIELI